MRLAYIVCIFSILCFENALLQASRKKHRYKGLKTKQKRAAEVNRELAAFQGDHYWYLRQEIIREAVIKRAINPDLLRSGGSLMPNTPLVECAQLAQTKKDFEYAEFLLKHGANACTEIIPQYLRSKQPYIEKQTLLAHTQKIEMAQLLMQYGAYHEVQNKWSKGILHYTPKSDKEKAEDERAEGILAWLALAKQMTNVQREQSE